MSELAVDPIVIQITPTLELLSDIVTTAVEGGIGYWSVVTRYKWRETLKQVQTRLAANNETADIEALEALREKLPFPIAEIIELEDEDKPEDENPHHTITPEVIRRGMQLAMTPGILHPNSNTFRSVHRALMSMDAGEIDADAADNIVQLGLFGRVVYA